MYDLIILGAGPGGYVAAIKAGQLGAKVLLIEKENLGGVCLNHGCIPTKALLKNAKMYHDLFNASNFGISVNGDISFDFQKMVSRKDDVVKQLTSGVGYLLKKNNVEVVIGEGVVLAKDKVQVDQKVYQTKKLILATGSSPIILPIDGANEAYQKGTLLTYRELLNIKKVPKTLTIIGGGVIGVEFATIFTLLGSKVTIIEKLPFILPLIDETVREAYVKELKALGITIIVDTEVKQINNKEVSYILNNKNNTLKSELILMAVGTRANTKDFTNLNLKMDGPNVVTNEYLQTSISDVYAIGDLNGKMMLAHTASHEALVSVSHALQKDVRKMDYTKIPQAIYGTPEIASVGLTEAEAKAKGRPYKTATFPLSASGKAFADHDKRGFIKLIFDTQYDELIGGHIFANTATEMISELTLALNLEVTGDELIRIIHPHPTLSESITEAALLNKDKAIHI